MENWTVVSPEWGDLSDNRPIFRLALCYCLCVEQSKSQERLPDTQA